MTITATARKLHRPRGVLDGKTCIKISREDRENIRAVQHAVFAETGAVPSSSLIYNRAVRALRDQLQNKKARNVFAAGKSRA